MGSTKSKVVTGAAGAALFLAGIGIGAASSGSAPPAAAEPQAAPTVTSTVTHEVSSAAPTVTAPAKTVTTRVKVPGPTVTRTVKVKAPDAAKPNKPEEAANKPPADTSGESMAQANARAKAEDYLGLTAFSRSGLIEQLKFEGFSTADATYGVDALHANWNKQAALKAKDYLDLTSFSRSGLIEQLKFDGFTTAQATYGVNQTGL